MKLKLIKTILIALVLGINFFIFKSEFSNSFTSFQNQNLISDVKLGRRWSNFALLRTDAVEFSGWSKQDNIDLSLDPQTSGLAIYEFTKPEAAKVTILQLAISYPGNGSNKVSMSTNKVNWQTIAENKNYHLVPKDITQYLKGSQRFWVKLEASNNNPLSVSEQKPAVILYDFNLMFYQREFKIPRLDLMLLTIFFPILLIIRPKTKKAFQFALLFLVFYLGLHLALQNLNVNRYHSFDSDILCLTKEVPRFISSNLINKLLGYYCSAKESGVMLITFGLWSIFGYGSEMAVKLSSFLFHLLTIVFVFYYGGKIKSFTTGLIAALFFSLNPYLIELSARGLRDSAFTFITTVFVYLLFVSDLKLIRNKILLFLTAIFVIYIRSQSLFQFIGLVPVFIIFQLIKKHLPRFEILKQSLFVIFSLLLLVLPLSLMSLKTYHTWNHASIGIYKWMANVEFSGQTGFPSKESERMDPRQGPAISFTTYFFKLHTIPDLITSSLKGVRQTFNDLYFKNNLFGLILFIIGGWLMFKDKHFWYIPFLVFFLEIPHFFMVQKNLLEFRSMTHSLPFIGLTIGYIIDRIWVKLKRC